MKIISLSEIAKAADFVGVKKSSYAGEDTLNVVSAKELEKMMINGDTFGTFYLSTYYPVAIINGKEYTINKEIVKRNYTYATTGKTEEISGFAENYDPRKVWVSL